MANYLYSKGKMLCLSSRIMLAWMCADAASRIAAQSTRIVDRIVIEKSKRTLTLMDGAKIVSEPRR